MEEMEQRVWQRVRAEQEQVQNSTMKAMALASMEAAGRYRTMHGKSNGKIRELTGKLWEQEQEILKCLKGLYRLQEGARLRCGPAPIPEQTGGNEQIRWYHNARRAHMEYMSRAAEPEWGIVFQQLAEMQKKQCVLLTQLVGMV